MKFKGDLSGLHAPGKHNQTQKSTLAISWGQRLQHPAPRRCWNKYSWRKDWISYPPFQNALFLSDVASLVYLCLVCLSVFPLFRIYSPWTYFVPSTVAPGTHQGHRSQPGSTLQRCLVPEETDSKQASKQIRMTQSHLPIKLNLLIEGDKHFP